MSLSAAKSATTTADNSGAYAFSGLSNGGYVVTPSHAGYTFNPPTKSITVNGADVTGVNFAASQGTQTFSISGTISPTAGGSGATVTLSGAANAVTTTNASGGYAFTGLANGSFTVTPNKPGYTFVPASQSVTITTANLTGVNFSSEPAPGTFLATAETYGGNQIVLSGLPSTLGQVVVQWWNGTTSSWDNKVATFGEYGMPSEYYIEASRDGSTWTSLTHLTNNQYNQRQFAYDFTGTGYTQVRLRIVSFTNALAGKDKFTIFSTPNNPSDTFLFLGDSISANCWGNQYPSEPYGTQINAARPNRFPVATSGGVPGLQSSSLVATYPGTSIPTIRQWLNDFPDVKFVGLSFGTNDANSSIPTATYIANMQAAVQEVIAAGKTPVIPTIVASPSANVQANAPAMNVALAMLESQYPAIIKGPDLWSVFQGHSVADGWFSDSLHPSLTTGCTAWQSAWINAMISALYPQ